MDSGKSFEDSLNEALEDLAPDGLDEIQRETDLLLHSNIISMKKLMYSVGLATSISITMGLMMKILHMPGGEELVNYGFLSFVLLFLPMITIHLYKTGSVKLSHQKFKMVFGILSALCTGMAVFFKLTISLDASGMMLMIGASIFSFGFLPLHFLGMYRKSVAQ